MTSDDGVAGGNISSTFWACVASGAKFQLIVWSFLIGLYIFMFAPYLKDEYRMKRGLSKRFIREVVLLFRTSLNLVWRWTLHSRIGATLFVIYLVYSIHFFILPIADTIFAYTGILIVTPFTTVLAASIVLGFVLYVLATVVIERVKYCKTRLITNELIDMGPQKGNYTMQEYHKNLQDMASINKLLDSNRYMMEMAFGKLDPMEMKAILDFGTGGGAFARELARRYVNSSVLGIDTSSEAIKFAISQTKALDQNITFETRDHVELREPDNSFDVVTCTLVCHHIPTDDAVVQFLRDAHRVARRAIIINDLERDPIAAAAYRVVMFPLYRRNRLTKLDGLTSVRRSFTRSEWERYLQAAGFVDVASLKQKKQLPIAGNGHRNNDNDNNNADDDNNNDEDDDVDVGGAIKGFYSIRWTPFNRFVIFIDVQK